jgi:hypothetical protein
MIKCLNLLPTERLARKYRNDRRTEMHKQVDKLAKGPTRPWLRGSIQPAALTILAFAVWISAGALVAKAFDPVERASLPAQIATK